MADSNITRNAMAAAMKALMKEKKLSKDYQNDDLQPGRRTLCAVWQKDQIRGHDHRSHTSCIIRWIRCTGKPSVYLPKLQHIQRQDAPGHVF